MGGTGVEGEYVKGNIVRNNTVQILQVGQSATPDKYGIYWAGKMGLSLMGIWFPGDITVGYIQHRRRKSYIIRGNEVFNVGGNGIHNNADHVGVGVIKNALIEKNVIHNVGFGIGGQAISCDGVQD